MREMR